MSREWDNREERLTPEEQRRERDREFLERKPCNKDRINLSKLRATDIPSCKDMIMPGPVNMRDELKIQERSQRYMDTVRDYMCEQCDKKGVINESDVLTCEEQVGMDEIRKRSAKRVTDKRTE